MANILLTGQPYVPTPVIAFGGRASPFQPAGWHGREPEKLGDLPSAPGDWHPYWPALHSPPPPVLSLQFASVFCSIILTIVCLSFAYPYVHILDSVC